MKILFITDNFPPELNAPATRTFEHCLHWKSLGADITVITCAPNFPKGKVFNGYKNSLHKKEIMEGIKVIRVWTFITQNKGFLKRIIDYMSFGFASFLAGLPVKCDVIIATSPQFFTTISAFLLSIFKNRPWVFELRDLWPESIKTVGAIRNNIIINILEKIEIFLYKRADLIITVTEPFRKNLIKRGIDKGKIKVVTNGVNPELFKVKAKDKDLLTSLNITDKLIFGFIGTFGMAHNLSFIINSIKKVKDNRIHFLFIGDGAKKEDVVNEAKNLKLKNVTFLDPVGKDILADYLSIIDIALVPLKKSETFKTVIPSKIFESCAMEKPVLIGVDGEARRIIEKYNAGIFFEPENEKDFLEKIFFLNRNKTMVKKFKQGCIKLASDYSRDKLAKKMLQYISTIKK